MGGDPVLADVLLKNMAYRNKTYVAFDADSDIHYYRLMTAWKQRDNSSFNFYDAHDIKQARDRSTEETIKRSLSERFMNSKMFVLLVGEKTRYLYKYVKWEIEQGIKRDIPIVCVNLNSMRQMDQDRCPPIIREHLAVHISFNASILQHALQNWSDSYFNLKRGVTPKNRIINRERLSG